MPERTVLLHKSKGWLNALLLWLLLTSFQTVAAETAQQGSIDFSALIYSANLANAAYLTEAEIRQLIEPKNGKLSQYHTLPESQVSYFMVTDDAKKIHYIAVRGTSNLENTIVNISLQLTLDQRSGLRLHKGFAVAAQQIYSNLQPFLKKGYKIQTTGHSLGGAIALILAMYLDKDQYKIGQIITFGQPKVTNMSGARQLAHLNVIRVVTALDLVPLIPPFDPLDIHNLDIYWHTGIEVLLLGDKRYSILEGINSMLRATKFTQQPLNEMNLQNHTMSFYLELLDRDAPMHERVPYKNRFNLFNLFGKE